MKTSIAALTALAGSLLLAPLMMGPTQAQSAPDLKNAVSAIHNGAVTLVRGGGGGHGGGGWGGGGHPGAMARGDGGGRDFAGPRMGVSRSAEGRDRGHFEHGDRGRFVERHDRGERFEHRRFAQRGHDFDRFHHRHRVFVNGIWVWAYWDDCWWLRRQALITGSPYWWSRYNYCVGYY
jgi:hypothetical protein